ncbi:MAG: isoprenylcysteine carboxylmethyltransferase family protein, partial [Gammaproteobacteria bacterium]|nr:isoprenylcysteine carboxylmethyltransferase family protein [Gammaproteobacteria bacterium]
MHRLLPPKLLILTALAMVVLRVALPGLIIISTPWNLLGLPVLCAGLALAIVASRLFETVGTNIMTFDNPDLLVTSGPFSFSRNPMYLSMGVVVIGLAFLLGSAWPLLPAAAFCLALDRWYVRF